MPRALHLLVILALAVPVRAGETDTFMNSPGLVELHLLVGPNERNQINAQPRNYVRARLHEGPLPNNQPLTAAQGLEVGFHLKGAAGSFRGFDDRPAITINMDKYAKKQAFHGMDKFHLNNSVQDGGYLHETMARWLFLKAGLPVTRARHAVVRLNGRDLGLYVLVEGFDKPWLKRQFGDSRGNLYDGGFCQDLDGAKKLLEGAGTDQPDIKKVWAAVGEPDPAKRLERLSQLVEIDLLLSFAAMECFAAHWDGYTNNVNNYRLYFDPGRQGRLVMLPSGMDQMWGDPNYTLFPGRGGLFTRLIDCPGVRARYVEILRKLHAKVHDLPAFDTRVDAMATALKPKADITNQAKDLKRRFSERAARVGQMLAAIPETPRFTPGQPWMVTGFEPKIDQGALKPELAPVPPAKPAVYRLTAAGPGVASFRRVVQLDPGVYRLDAMCRVKGVVGSQEPYTGAGVRLSGGTRNNALTGTAGFSKLNHEFTVASPGPVTLVLELRCQKGEAEFDAGSVSLSKLR